MADEKSYLFGLFSQTSDSSELTNSTVETSIVGSGQGSLAVPANMFKVGDSFHAKIGGNISAQNGDQITIKIKSGAIVLATTGLITLSPATDNGWECELDFTITAIGVSGNVKTNGNFEYNRDTGTLEGVVFNDMEALDTTGSNMLDITAEWAQEKTQDKIKSTIFILRKTF